MMSDTRNLLSTHPWVTFAPGIAIFVSVVIFNLFGDTVRDWLDPRNER
jgi:peptide/nickel transport system permease protein